MITTMEFVSRKMAFRNGGRSLPVPPVNHAWERVSTVVITTLVAATVIYMNCVELRYTFNVREMRMDHIVCTSIWIAAVITLVVNGLYELEYRIKTMMYNMFILDAPKTTTYEDTTELESMKVNPLVTAHPDTFPSCQLMVLTCNDQGVWCRAGNGFRISKTIVVPTHVIDTSSFGAKCVRLAVPEGARLGKMVVVEAPIKDILTIGDDISLISIPEAELNRLGVTAARVKTLDTKQTSVMAMIYSYAPLFKASVGKISQFDGLAQQIEFSGSTIQGFSGAPYVAGKNDVYGMHTSGGAVNFGIAASYLQLLVLGTESNDTITKSQDNPLSRLIRRFMELENGSSVVPESKGGYSSDRTLEEFLSDWDNKKKGKIGRNWNDSLGSYVYSIEGRFYNITEDIDNYAQIRFPHLFEDAELEYDIYDDGSDRRVRRNKFSGSKRYANPVEEDDVSVDDYYDAEEDNRLEERRRKKVEFDEFVRKHELDGSAWWADESASKRVRQTDNVGMGALFNSLTKLTALVEELKQRCLAAETKSDLCRREHQQLMKQLLVCEANADPNVGYKDDSLMEPLFHGDSEAELLADYNQMVAPMLVEDELDLLRQTINKSEVSYEEVQNIRSICNRLTQLGKFSNQLLSTIDKIRADKKKREAEERARKLELEMKVRKEEELKRRALEMEETRVKQENEAKEKEAKRDIMCKRIRQLFESLSDEEIREFTRLMVERNTERAVARKAEKEKVKQEVLTAVARPVETTDKEVVLEGANDKSKGPTLKDIKPPPKGSIRCPSCIIKKAKDRPCFSNKADFFKHMEEAHLMRLEAAPSGN
ncbi:ORF1 [Varroa destructor virus 5]|nr:ORF1 [Varroa destructor virus 5]